MNTHSYLRAYMAGISVPTPLLLVALLLFSIARFVYNAPVPVELSVYRAKRLLKSFAYPLVVTFRHFLNLISFHSRPDP